MALLIQTPDSPNSTQVVSLNAKQITLNIRWNTIDSSWSMDAYIGDVPLRLGISFKSNRDFTSKYIDMTKQLGGFFYCQRISNNTTDILTRDSFSEGTHRILFIEV